MQVVLTNDDGMDAPGLQALEDSCREWSEVTVVAPDRCHSSMSHRVNTESAIAVAQVAAHRFRVSASPADCARLARTRLAPEAEWLISGINRGGNLGMDICYSGTVAAAREAALLGLPAIAISHYIARGKPLDWTVASRRAGWVLRRLIHEGLAPGEFWNVNLSHVEANEPEPEICFCELDRSPLPVSYHAETEGFRYAGKYPERLREAGTDVDLCFQGKITATRLRAGF